MSNRLNVTLDRLVLDLDEHYSIVRAHEEPGVPEGFQKRRLQEEVACGGNLWSIITRWREEHFVGIWEDVWVGEKDGRKVICV